MSIDYDNIAPDYDRHRRGGGPYFASLLACAAQAPAGRVLELGAGTGNETRAFLAAHPRPLIALERSAGMLAQLRAKQLPAVPVQASATHLPFAPACLAFVFGAYMLHYIDALEAFFAECRRVLQPGGALAVVTVPEHFIAQHPMNRFFPSFALVDLARFQPIDHVVAAMRDAGFEAVSATTDIGPPRPVDAAYLARIEARFISTYDLIPPNEFAAGVAALRAALAEPGGTGLTIAREATTVCGWNPA